MWLVANNGDGFRRCKVPQPPPGARGCSHNNKLYSSSSAVWRRAYKTSCPLLGLFSYHIRRALPHSNIWLWQLPLQSTSAAARGDGALGGRCRHCPCFWFVEMTEQGAKAKPFYNVMTNSRCRVRIRLSTLSQLVNSLRIFILFWFKRFIMDPTWTIKKIMKDAPLKGIFHNNGRGILTTF